MVPAERATSSTAAMPTSWRSAYLSWDVALVRDNQAKVSKTCPTTCVMKGATPPTTTDVSAAGRRSGSTPCHHCCCDSAPRSRLPAEPIAAALHRQDAPGGHFVRCALPAVHDVPVVVDCILGLCWRGLAVQAPTKIEPLSRISCKVARAFEGARQAHRR